MPQPSRQRAFLTPNPGDDWKAIAARALPGETLEAAMKKLQSWNLHLFMRMPPGQFLGSDVIFVEPPREPAPSFLGVGDAGTS
jgi:hypothetical protein